MIPILFSGAGQDPYQNALVLYTTCGPADDFDPTITGVAGIWYFGDGAQLAVASGVSAHHTYATAGPHRAVFRPGPGGLAAITAIDCNTDLVTSIKTMKKLTKCTSLIGYTNSGLIMQLSDLPRGLTIVSFSSDPLLTGDIADLPRGLTIAHFYSDPLLTGDIANLPRELTIAYFYFNPLLTGDIANLPSGLTIAHFYSNPRLTAGSIAHLTAIRDLRIYSMGWNTASVDTVIDSIYTARASFTYSTGPSLLIGGANASPTGTYTDPTVTPGDGNSNSDWSWDGTKHVPLTPKAKIYYLVNGPDHGSDTFYKWSISYTL